MREKLEVWYDEHGRDLPWRRTKDPYRIWVSEVILQQTTVKQGWDYYLRLVARFPDVETLAKAEEDEVLRMWQGLGYYSRARNLHTAARQILEAGGVFPRDYEAVRALKGIGDYTAAAICSIAYNQPYAVVDGNVYRVLSRYFASEIPIDTPAGKRHFADLAQRVLDKDNPGLYNQAVMDFGAVQCTPKSPDCEKCPLNDKCGAYSVGRQEDFPVKSRKTKVADERLTYLLTHDDEAVYLRKRPENGIWAGLYEAPVGKGQGRPFFKTTHVLTHKRIHCAAYDVTVAHKTEIKCFQRVLWKDLDNYALSRLMELIIKKFLENE